VPPIFSKQESRRNFWFSGNKRWTWVTNNYGSKYEVEGQGHCERKYENSFLLISSSKVVRFTSNQDQHYHRPHGSENDSFCDICLQLLGTAACRSGHLAILLDVRV